VGIAELHETGAFSVFHHAALERHGAQLIDLSAAWPHCVHPYFANGAHHNHMGSLNKTALTVIVSRFKE
jgi:hypothetical protein